MTTVGWVLVVIVIAILAAGIYAYSDRRRP